MDFLGTFRLSVSQNFCLLFQRRETSSRMFFSTVLISNEGKACFLLYIKRKILECSLKLEFFDFWDMDSRKVSDFANKTSFIQSLETVTQ